MSKPVISKQAKTPQFHGTKARMFIGADLDTLSAEAAAFRAKDQEILSKIEKFSKFTKERKKAVSLNKHKVHWEQEAMSLQRERDGVEREFQKLLESGVSECASELRDDWALQKEEVSDLSEYVFSSLRVLRERVHVCGMQEAVRQVEEFKDSIEASMLQLSEKENALTKELVPLLANITSESSNLKQQSDVESVFKGALGGSSSSKISSTPKSNKTTTLSSTPFSKKQTSTPKVGGVTTRGSSAAESPQRSGDGGGQNICENENEFLGEEIESIVYAVRARIERELTKVQDSYNSRVEDLQFEFETKTAMLMGGPLPKPKRSNQNQEEPESIYEELTAPPPEDSEEEKDFGDPEDRTFDPERLPPRVPPTRPNLTIDVKRATTQGRPNSATTRPLSSRPPRSATPSGGVGSGRRSGSPMTMISSARRAESATPTKSKSLRPDSARSENSAPIKLRIDFQGDTGGWDSLSHAKYVKLKNEFDKYKMGTGLGMYTREEFLERVGMEMPGKTKKEIEVHDQWYTHMIYLKKKIHALKEDCGRERKKILDSVNDTLQEEVQRFLEDQSKRSEFEKLEKRRNETHQVLDVLRRDREERDKLEMERVQREEAERKAKQAALEKERQKEMCELKVKVTEYKKAKEEQTRLEIEIEEQRKALEAIQQKKAAQHNKARVEFRFNELMKKMEEKKMQVARLEFEQREREERLERLRELVRIEAEADPDRILKPTVAAKMHVQADEEEQAMFSVHGYTMDQMMKDTRFKLQMALREAGLLDKPYAKQILAQAKPARAPRMDMFTTDQKEAYSKSGFL